MVETYLILEGAEEKIEFDLVVNKTKGKEEKYLMITQSMVVPIDEEGNTEWREIPCYIDTEEQFNKIKEYFSKLTWA